MAMIIVTHERRMRIVMSIAMCCERSSGGMYSARRLLLRINDMIGA